MWKEASCRFFGAPSAHRKFGFWLLKSCPTFQSTFEWHWCQIQKLAKVNFKVLTKKTSIFVFKQLENIHSFQILKFTNRNRKKVYFKIHHLAAVWGLRRVNVLTVRGCGGRGRRQGPKRQPGQPLSTRVDVTEVTQITQFWKIRPQFYINPHHTVRQLISTY